jgi:ribosomal protein S18 acetylase RimI-like enzyme
MTAADDHRVQVRPTRPADHDAIWEIFREVVAPGDTYAFAPDTSREEALWLWVVTSHASFVAESEGDILGSYFLRPNQPGLGAHVANAGYMVAGRARGRGVARAMCEHSLAEARRLGYRAMQFNFVVATNASAVHLWESMGFEVVGRLPGAFRHASLGYVDALVMYRRL